MFGFLVRAASMLFVCVMGWILGTVYPAPAALVSLINPKAIEVRLQRSLQAIDIQRFKDLLSPEQRKALFDEALSARVAEGKAIVVEQLTPETLEQQVPENAATTLVAAANAAFEPTLFTCPQMTVSNAPRVDATRKVVQYAPQVKINDVTLAANPTKGACLSSAFGPRGGRVHRGVDYHARDGGPILAAGDGTVLELKYRDDYGNMVLIDHGKGVYTRYAHLSSFQRGLAVGATVKAGDQIGLMGNTASYAVPIHLHYEVLTGDYNASAKASFGLEPQNVLTAPGAL